MLTDEFAQLRQDSILQMHKILEKVDAVKVNIFLLAAFLFVLYVVDVLNITFRVVWVTFKMLIVATLCAAYMWVDLQNIQVWFYKSLFKKMSGRG